MPAFFGPFRYYTFVTICTYWSDQTKYIYPKALPHTRVEYVLIPHIGTLFTQTNLSKITVPLISICEVTGTFRVVCLLGKMEKCRKVQKSWFSTEYECQGNYYTDHNISLVHCRNVPFVGIQACVGILRVLVVHSWENSLPWHLKRPLGKKVTWKLSGACLE